MSDTQPYAVISPCSAQAVSGEEEGYLVEVAGCLFLQPDGAPRILRIFDAHPELAEVMHVGYDRVEVRRRSIEVDSGRWTSLRRGLVLCAAHAVTGQVVATRRGAWQLALRFAWR